MMPTMSIRRLLRFLKFPHQDPGASFGSPWNREVPKFQYGGSATIKLATRSRMGRCLRSQMTSGGIFSSGSISM